VLQHLLSKPQMAAWGWRIPFLVGAALAVVAYWMRRRMHESESYLRMDAVGAQRGGVRALLAAYPRETSIVLGLSAGGAIMFYIYATYMQKFLANTAGFSKDRATEISALTLLVFMAAQPLCGWLSDKVGRRPMIMAAFGGGLLITYPLMSALAGTRSSGIAFLLIVAGALTQSCYSSISAVVKAELFPAQVRTLGVALPYAVANALFGGTAEYAALSFKTAGNESGFYVYASAVCALSFATALVMRDTGRHSRIIED
jgi:MHS family alpha-ketoglutarate permease-like MFS transporter